MKFKLRREVSISPDVLSHLQPLMYHFNFATVWKFCQLSNVLKHQEGQGEGEGVYPASYVSVAAAAPG